MSNTVGPCKRSSIQVMIWQQPGSVEKTCTATNLQTLATDRSKLNDSLRLRVAATDGNVQRVLATHWPLYATSRRLTTRLNERTQTRSTMRKIGSTHTKLNLTVVGFWSKFIKHLTLESVVDPSHVLGPLISDSFCRFSKSRTWLIIPGQVPRKFNMALCGVRDVALVRVEASKDRKLLANNNSDRM